MKKKEIQFNLRIPEDLKAKIDEGAKLMEKYDIIPEPLAKKAIPETEITYVAGEEMKEKISVFQQQLQIRR